MGSLGSSGKVEDFLICIQFQNLVCMVAQKEKGSKIPFKNPHTIKPFGLQATEG